MQPNNTVFAVLLSQSEYMNSIKYYSEIFSDNNESTFVIWKRINLEKDSKEMSSLLFLAETGVW